MLEKCSKQCIQQQTCRHALIYNFLSDVFILLSSISCSPFGFGFSEKGVCARVCVCVRARLCVGVEEAQPEAGCRRGDWSQSTQINSRFMFFCPKIVTSRCRLISDYFTQTKHLVGLGRKIIPRRDHLAEIQNGNPPSHFLRAFLNPPEYV